MNFIKVPSLQPVDSRSKRVNREITHSPEESRQTQHRSSCVVSIQHFHIIAAGELEAFANPKTEPPGLFGPESALLLFSNETEGLIHNEWSSALNCVSFCKKFEAAKAEQLPFRCAH